MKKALTILAVIALGFLAYKVWGFRPEFETHVSLKYSAFFIGWGLLLAAIAIAMIILFAKLLEPRKKSNPTYAALLKHLLTRRPEVKP